MIKTIQVRNFQSHKQSRVNLSPGVNVFIGPSDAGKSALFRAVTWVLTNRPLGDAFQSEWAEGDTEVILETEQGKVRRSKGSCNEYEITRIDEDPILLKAFGTEPPEAVNTLLEMDLVNVQSQTDPPFLLAESPGEVARLLNKAANIQDIDTTSAGLRKGKKELEHSVNSLEQFLADQEMELQNYKNLAFLEGLVRELEDMERQRVTLTRKSKQIKYLCTQARAVREQIKEIKETNEVEKHLSEAEQLHATIKKGKKRITRLRELIRTGRQLQTSIKEVKRKVQKLESEYTQTFPDLCPLCGARIGENHAC